MPNEVDIDYINVVAEAKVKGVSELDKFADALAKCANAKALAIKDNGEFETLLKTLQGFKSLGNLGANLTKISAGVASFGNAAKSLHGIMNFGSLSTQMSIIGTSLAKMNGIKLPNINRFSEGITSLANSIKNISDADMAKLTQILPSLERVSALRGSTMLGKTLAGLPAALASITEADIAKMERLAPVLSRISAAMRGANTQMLASFKAMAKQLSGVTKDLQKYTTTMQNVDKSTKKASHGQNIFKNMLVRLKNIAFKKLINTLINNFMTSLRGGLANAYQYSVLTNNQFAKTMDKFASIALYLKNSVGAALMPVLNALVPVLERISDAVVDMLNYINQAVAVATGASTWTRAIKYQTTYADAANETANALNRTLLSLDEINKMNSENGGSSKATEDYSKMFVTEQVTTNMQNMFANLDLGSSLGKMITKGFEKLNTPEFKEKLSTIFSKIFTNIENFFTSADFEKIGQSIVGVLNGAISWLAGGGLGKIVAGIINAAVGLVNGVSLQTKWEELGAAISENIKTALENIKWGDLLLSIGTSIVDAITAPIRTIKGIIFDIFSALYWALPQGLRDVMPDWMKEIAADVEKNDGYLSGREFEEAMKGLVSSTGTARFPTSTLSGNKFTTPTQYASGGFPTTGQLFLANESGPEMVGSIGSRTAVANNGQIVEGIKAGVMEAMSAAGGDWTIQIVDYDGRVEATKVISSAERMNRRTGRTIIPLGV